MGTVSLGLGLAAGFVMHRSDFCMAGMFRDLFLFRRTVMIRSLFLLVVATMLLFEAGRRTGIIGIYPFPLLYAPTLANVIGGCIFGIGMVLAGGCVVGTLYKIGAGSVLSMVCFIGIVLGSGFYAQFHPAWAQFIKSTTFAPWGVTLGQILRVDPVVFVAPIGAIGILLLARWFKAGEMSRTAEPEGYIQPWKTALVLAVISFLSYALIGMPMGVTSSYAKLAGFFDRLIAPGHFEELAFYKAVPLKYTQPILGTTLEGGGGPVFDALAVIQVPLIFGIIAGSFLSALILGEFHLYWRVPSRQYLSVAVGGILMGLASRMAPTCNVWHIFGGLPLLAASSILFLAGIVLGAWMGSRLLVRLVLK